MLYYQKESDGEKDLATNKDFCNTEVTLIWASLEAARPHPCGCTSVFLFGTGQIRGASEALHSREQDWRSLWQQKAQQGV